MDGEAVTLRQADDAIEYVERLLAANELPTADVRSNPGSFYVGYAGDDPVGVGGIETYDTDGLLRSVVVEGSVRGEGYGTELCDRLAARARDEGVRTLYLLTTTASGFFADRGFVPIDRTEAPAAIRQTTEFADLCPGSATCMRTSL